MSSFEPLSGWGRRGGFAASGPAPTGFRGESVVGPLPPTARVATDTEREEAEARAHRAYEEGFAAGRREVLEREQERAFAALEDASRAILGLRDGYLATNRTLVVDLALEVARVLSARPVGDEIAALSARLEPALASLPDEGPLRLRLAPGDHARIVGEGDCALATRLESRGVVIGVDGSLANGEFRLDSGATELDGRRDALLADLRGRLLTALGGEAG